MRYKPIDNHSHLYLDSGTTYSDVTSMYVCLCNGISDRQIRECVERGASCFDEVQARLPIANCCGHCEDTARKVIESHVETASRPIAA
jgi:bacterioferritin-associated ferredoxin